LAETLVKDAKTEHKFESRQQSGVVNRMAFRAIRSNEKFYGSTERLGINDPLTHLFQYLERGDDALVGIIEDIETDIAERLPKMPFVNYVGFEFTGDDFVSAKDRVSMKKMTENNFKILRSEQCLPDEIARAEVEAEEVDRLSSWFKAAKDGEFLVFESLPIGKQTVAVSRIYQKTGENSLNGGFVSLYNPSVEMFNDFRKQNRAGKSDCRTELEVLENHYECSIDTKSMPMDQFIEQYVVAYDELQDKKCGKKHRFGLVVDDETVIYNGLEKVRQQPKLTSVYIDAIQSLAIGGGRVSDELICISQKLGLGLNLDRGDTVSARTARTILSGVIRGITSVIDRAGVDLLSDIEQSDSGPSVGYAVVSHYGSEARDEGVSYDSEACPESSFASHAGLSGGNRSESDILQNIFNPFDFPPNFGDRKLAMCRTRNCPTRKKPLVTVGGCGFCVKCHHLLEEKDKPERYYDEKWKEEIAKEIKRKKEEEERALREQEEYEKVDKLRVAKLKKVNLIKFKKIKVKTKHKNFWEGN
jgi:hypothetical protein